MNLTTRAACSADYEAFLALFAELGAGDPPPSRERWEREMAPDILMLGDDAGVVAYAWSRALFTTGFVFHVAVHARARGRGVGQAMMDAVRARLRGLGCTSWVLNVRIDNEPAIRLYDRCGLRRVHRSTSFDLPWSAVASLPREATNVLARTFHREEEAGLETAFGLPPGRLGDLRGRGSRVMMRLVDPSRPEDFRVGLAAFEINFPGSYPFAVARPTLAAPLLEAIRPHARPEHEFSHVMVEADDALSEVLRAAGGEPKLELWFLRGSL